jgi:osmotically-inducible protein OsmY
MSAGVCTFHHFEVHVVCGTVHLVGQVTSFHAKQLAQEAARQVSGVDEIVNLLQVEGGLDSAVVGHQGGENKAET